MKKKYHTVWTIPKSNRKIVERGKIIPHNIQVQHAHFPGLVHSIQYKMAGLRKIYDPKSILLVKWWFRLLPIPRKQFFRVLQNSMYI